MTSNGRSIFAMVVEEEEMASDWKSMKLSSGQKPMELAPDWRKEATTWELMKADPSQRCFRRHCRARRVVGLRQHLVGSEWNVLTKSGTVVMASGRCQVGGAGSLGRDSQEQDHSHCCLPFLLSLFLFAQFCLFVPLSTMGCRLVL